MKSWTDVQAIASGDAKIMAFSDPGGTMMSLAYAELNPTQWGAIGPNNDGGVKMDGAAIYLAAHLFTVGSRTGGFGGPTTTEKVGDVSRSSAVKIDDPDLQSTPYGREFHRRLKQLGLQSRVFVSGGANMPPAGFGGAFFP